MNERTWSLQDAKNKFSEVVNGAKSGTPQIVTRRGVPTVVVPSIDEFNRYKKVSEISLPSFTDHLLSMPADDTPFERLDTAPRKSVE